MTREVHAKEIIDLPIDMVWGKLRDLSLAHNYVPGIVKTTIVSEQAEGVGASRHVYRNARSFIQETVEEWREGQGFLIRLHRGDKPAPPFSNAWFRYALAEDGADRTRLTTSLTYTMPWGRLGGWLENRMAGLVQATIADVALAMKLYYESGEPTTPGALKIAKAARRKAGDADFDASGRASERGAGEP